MSADIYICKVCQFEGGQHAPGCTHEAVLKEDALKAYELAPRAVRRRVDRAVSHGAALRWALEREGICIV